MNANVNVNGAGTVTTALAALQFSATCSNGIAIKQFSFNPATIPAGQNSTLTLVLQNCTSQTIQGSNILYGRYAWAGSGIAPWPPGYRPGGVPLHDCAGSYLHPVAAVGGHVPGLPGHRAHDDRERERERCDRDSGDRERQPGDPAAGEYLPCHLQPEQLARRVHGQRHHQQRRFGADQWLDTHVSFPGDQKIANAWNAAVSQTGQNVSAANLSYNATIPAGGSQSFGFQGTWTSSDASPTSFSVNGVACS